MSDPGRTHRYAARTAWSGHRFVADSLDSEIAVEPAFRRADSQGS